MTAGHGVPLGLAVEGANRPDLTRRRAPLDSLVVEPPEPPVAQPQGRCVDPGDADDEVRALRVAFGFTAHIRARAITIPRTKNDDSLIVSLNRSAVAVLKAIPRKGEFLFPGVNSNMVSMAFRRAVKRAGVLDFHFHDLRHTFVSWLHMEGQDIRTIQKNSWGIRICG